MIVEHEKFVSKQKKINKQIKSERQKTTHTDLFGLKNSKGISIENWYQFLKIEPPKADSSNQK